MMCYENAGYHISFSIKQHMYFYQSEFKVDLGKILLELRWVVETIVLEIDYIT